MRLSLEAAELRTSYSGEVWQASLPSQMPAEEALERFPSELPLDLSAAEPLQGLPVKTPHCKASRTAKTPESLACSQTVATLRCTA
jgi:hypothetical protein